MSTQLEQIKAKLQPRGVCERVARELGMSPRTLRYIANGQTPNPGIGTVEKIAAYFRSKETRAA